MGFLLEWWEKMVNVGWDLLSNVTDLVNLELLEKVIVYFVEDTSNNYEAL